MKGENRSLFMVRRDTESVLEVDSEGWVPCQEPEVVGRTFQQKYHHEQRQSYPIMDSLQASEQLRLAKGQTRTNVSDKSRKKDLSLDYKKTRILGQPGVPQKVYLQNWNISPLQKKKKSVDSTVKRGKENKVM